MKKAYVPYIPPAYSKPLTIKVEKLPLIAVLLSMIALYISILFSLSLTFTVWFFLLPVFILFFYSRHFHLLDKRSNFMLFIVAVIFIISQFLGRNFVMIDCGITFIVCSVIFRKCFSIHNNTETLKRSFLSLRKMYQCLIGLIFIEICLLLAGFGSFFSMIPGYHMNNRADIVKYTYLFEEYNAPDTIFLGRQIGGALALSGFIIFYNSRFRKRLFWLALTAFVFAFSATGTVLMLSVLAVLVSGLVLKKVEIRKASAIFKTILFILCFAAAVALSYDFVINSFFSRALSTDTVVSGLDPDDPGVGLSNQEYYFFVFFLPINQLVNQSMLSILFGAPKEYLLNTKNYFAGDFGFGFNLLRGGILIGIIYLSFIVTYISRGIKYIRKYFLESNVSNILKSLVLITLLYLLSQIHYINVTATVFFAYQFALLMFANDCLRSKK